MHNEDIRKFLKELSGTEVFKAQIALENFEIEKWTSKLVRLELDDTKLALQYAELKGAIKAIRELQAVRKTITSPSSVKGE